MIHAGTNDLTDGVSTMKEIRDLDKDKKVHIGFKRFKSEIKTLK